MHLMCKGMNRNGHMDYVAIAYALSAGVPDSWEFMVK